MSVIPPGFLEGLGAAACLGSSDFVSRTNSRRIGSFAAASLALTLGTIPFLLFWPFPDLTNIDQPSLIFALLAGLLNPVALWLVFKALARGPIAVVSPIITANPALVVLVNGFLGYSPGLLEGLALAMIFVGVLIVSGLYRGVQVLAAGEVAASVVVMAVSASLLLAFRLVMIELSVDGMGAHDAFILSRLASIVFCVGVFVVSVTQRQQLAGLGQLSWWPMLILHATLENLGALFLFTGSVGEGKTIMPVVFSTLTVFTLFWAVTIAKEKIAPRRWFGVAVVLTGVAFLAGLPIFVGS
jgi:drug/metabolite transporter (DMT)-like permease